MQICGLDDEVYAGLVHRATEAGVSVPELLRRHATRLAARPTVEKWLARTGRRASNISRDEVLDTLDELRGEWPEVGR